MSRYCFRCHGSVYYNVFDFERIFRGRAQAKPSPKSPLKSDIAAYISGFMPLDRKMSDSDQTALKNALNGIN